MKQKSIIIIILTFPLFNFFSQESKFEADIEWESSFHFDNIEFKVGKKLLFEQNCLTRVPKLLTKETVQFNNFYIQKIHFKMFMFFEDTIIKKALYFYEGAENDTVFKIFNLNKNNFQKIGETNYFYFRETENVRASCWFDDKKFFYQEEMIRPIEKEKPKKKKKSKK